MSLYAQPEGNKHNLAFQKEAGGQRCRPGPARRGTPPRAAVLPRSPGPEGCFRSPADGPGSAAPSPRRPHVTGGASPQQPAGLSQWRFGGGRAAGRDGRGLSALPRRAGVGKAPPRQGYGITSPWLPRLPGGRHCCPQSRRAGRRPRTPQSVLRGLRPIEGMEPGQSGLPGRARSPRRAGTPRPPPPRRDRRGRAGRRPRGTAGAMAGAAGEGPAAWRPSPAEPRPAAATPPAAANGQSGAPGRAGLRAPRCPPGAPAPPAPSCCSWGGCFESCTRTMKGPSGYRAA